VIDSIGLDKTELISMHNRELNKVANEINLTVPDSDNIEGNQRRASLVGGRLSVVGPGLKNPLAARASRAMQPTNVISGKVEMQSQFVGKQPAVSSNAGKLGGLGGGGGAGKSLFGNRSNPFMAGMKNLVMKTVFSKEIENLKSEGLKEFQRMREKENEEKKARGEEIPQSSFAKSCEIISESSDDSDD